MGILHFLGIIYLLMSTYYVCPFESGLPHSGRYFLLLIHLPEKFMKSLLLILCCACRQTFVMPSSERLTEAGKNGLKSKTPMGELGEGLTDLWGMAI